MGTGEEGTGGGGNESWLGTINKSDMIDGSDGGKGNSKGHGDDDHDHYDDEDDNDNKS